MADKYLIPELGSLALAAFQQESNIEFDVCVLLESAARLFSFASKLTNQTRCDLIWKIRRQLVMEGLDTRISESLDLVMKKAPSFATELVKSMVAEPILGYCDHCGDGDDEIVALIVLDCTCQVCHEKATPFSKVR